MALKRGKKAIGKNIEELQGSDKPRKQAIAASLALARKPGLKIKPRRLSRRSDKESIGTELKALRRLVGKKK